MDLIEALNGSRRYTLHSHTQYCDGRAPMHDFASAAVDAGFTHYGFSPHSPVPIQSPCNMTMADVPLYLAEVDRLRGIYTDRITLYAAMEIDYLGSTWGPSHDYFASLPLDYRIGSVHFIKDFDGQYIDIDGSAERFIANMAKHFRNDIRYVTETFFDASASMIEAGGFDILGHFDKIAQNASAYSPGIEDTSWYNALVSDLISLICSKRPIVEINTKAKAAHGRIFPHERHLTALIEAGVPLVVNSDAHQPSLIDASRDYAFNCIDKIKVHVRHNRNAS